MAIDSGGKLDRNQQLDGLRGFAALAVAVHHTLLGIGHPKALELWYATIQSLDDGYSIATKMALILFPGDVAVAIFLLSAVPSCSTALCMRRAHCHLLPQTSSIAGSFAYTRRYLFL